MNFEYQMLIDNIRDVMHAKGLKQKFIAECIGKTQQEFSNMMNRRVKITVTDAFFIANALGVSTDRLYEVRSNH